MINQSPMVTTALVALMLPCALSAQQVTARDAFWSASDLITVAPNPAVHKQGESLSRPHSNGSTEGSRGPGKDSNTKPPARSSEVAQLVMTNGYGAAPKLVRSAENRIGLRCSVMLRNADKAYAEVEPDSIFHSGDHIRLSFLANTPGYFYVIQQGSTGSWSPIFPPANAAADANKVSAGESQVVPSGTRAFLFDEHPGDEKLYVILSRTPIADIDRAVDNLRTSKSSPTEKPASDADSGQALEAVNRIPDEFVQRLASRDLSLVDEEKVDQSAKKDVQGEKAIYVVSKSSAPGPDGQVVLSLDLRHQ